MIEIGNINSAPKEKVLWIYDGHTLKPKAAVVMPDDTVYHQELMSEHNIRFSFNFNKKIDFLRPDYIKYKGLKYTLRKDNQPQEVSLRNYKYTLQFDAPEMFWLDILCFYRFQDLKELQWTLTGKPEQFFLIALENINSHTGEEWKIGIIEPTDVVNISFDAVNVYDMLTQVAEQYGCEWYIDYSDKTINLVGHYEQGEIISLRREIELTDISISNNLESDYCTRLYAFGSTRNIPSNYRGIESGSLVDAIVQKRLRLPISNGDYIDAFPDMKQKDIIEGSKIFDEIYPKRIGTITEIREVITKNDDGIEMVVYFFKDSGLQFKTDYILPGETLMLQFGDNSWLNGRDFELGYNDRTEEFEIINDQSNPDQIIPNEILKPRIGDQYVLYNFDISLVGDQYVQEAEQELLEEATKWMDSILEDNTTYSCTVNPVYNRNYKLDLQIGQKVRLRSVIFDEGEKLSRVYGFDKYLTTYKDIYLVGDKPKYSRLRTIEQTVDENKRQSDLQYIEAMKIAKGAAKNVKALNYLRTALENETVIDKGLLLTTLIRLGAMVGNEWLEKAGINGAAMNDDDVVAYFGGSLDDAVEGKTPIGFKMDGSGWLANRNILWDALGNLLLSGKFESNKDGNRIEIDPEDRSLKLINDIGQTLIHIYFERDESESYVFYAPKIILNHYGSKTEGDPYFTLDISGYEIRMYDRSSGYTSYVRPNTLGFINQNNPNAPSFGAGADQDNNGNEVLSVIMRGLPTSKESIYEGLYTTIIDGQTLIAKK